MERNFMKKTGRRERFSATFIVLVILLVGVFLPSVSAFNWETGIVSYYKLDETSGTTFYDSLGLNNGTINGSTIGETGILNYGYDNDGLDNIYLDDANSLDIAGNLTINMWIKLDTLGQYQQLIGKGATTMYDFMVFNNNSLRFFDDGGTREFFYSNKTIQINEWAMVSLTRNTATNKVNMYINGSQVGDYTFTGSPSANADKVYIGNIMGNFDFPLLGMMDEIGIWNRSLNSSEITELYNSGSALEYEEQVASVITLNSPTNGTTISDVGYDFNVYGNVGDGFNTTNVTYYIWNNDSSLHNKTTVLLGNQTFNTTLFIDDFSLGDYIWNAEVCWENATFSNCSFAPANYSFNVVPFSVLSETYSPSILEGSTSTFTANLSIITFDRLTDVFFVYNGTFYPATYTEYETNKWYLTYSKKVPTVASQTNVTFYWDVSLESGFSQNTTLHNQTINKIAIDDCSSYTYQILNLTNIDETTQTFLDGSGQNTSIKVDLTLSYLDNSGEVMNYSHNYDKVNPARVCMQNPIGNSSLRLDAVIEYSSADRFVEFYNIQNYVFNVNSFSQNITLYNLKESEGQEFKITYKGQDFIPVSDLIVQIQRNYIAEGEFKTIEIPMSGSNGYTIAHLVPNDVVYNLIFIKEGVVLSTFTEVIANCQNPTITECEINLNALITGSDLFDLIQDSEFFSSLTYDKDTRKVSSTYGIISGVSGLVKLNVSLIDNFGNNSVCSDSLNAAGGTLSCIVPEAFGNSTIYATVTYDGKVKREGYISQNQSPQEQYGGVLILGSIIMLMFVFGIGMSDNPAITGIFLILGSLLLVGLNLIYSTSILGAGATILWFIIAVVVIIIKGGGRR